MRLGLWLWLLALPALANELAVNAIWYVPEPGGTYFNFQLEWDGTYKAWIVGHGRLETRGQVPPEELGKLVRNLEQNPLHEFAGDWSRELIVFSAGKGPRNDGYVDDPACRKAVDILRASVVGRVRAELLKQLGAAPRSTAPTVPAPR